MEPKKWVRILEGWVVFDLCRGGCLPPPAVCLVSKATENWEQTLVDLKGRRRRQQPQKPGVAGPGRAPSASRTQGAGAASVCRLPVRLQEAGLEVGGQYQAGVPHRTASPNPGSLDRDF